MILLRFLHPHGYPARHVHGETDQLVVVLQHVAAILVRLAVAGYRVKR